MHDLAGYGTLIAIVLMGLAQFVGRRMSRDARRERERLAAAAPIPPPRRAAAPAPVAAPAVRRPAATARPPQRPAAGTGERPGRLPVTGPQAGGPRWAANAVIAAEVFGPPVADRPGGTLGPPNAF
jgi:hypothetical protein